MVVDPGAIRPEPEADIDSIEPSVDPVLDDDDDDDVDPEDLADDAIAALRDVIGPKLVANGTYAVSMESISYTELPLTEGPSYLTFNFRISKGRYAGKRITHRVELKR